MTANVARTTFLMPLESPNATLANTGGKGLNLARLVWAGFRVPSGFVATTAAYAEFVAANGLDAEIAAVLADGRLRRSCCAGSRGRAHPRCVRTRDDGAGVRRGRRCGVRGHRRAAGRRALFGHGRGSARPLLCRPAGHLSQRRRRGSLRQAIVTCWSSLWTARAIGYRARNDIAQEQTWRWPSSCRRWCRPRRRACSSPPIR